MENNEKIEADSDAEYFAEEDWTERSAPVDETRPADNSRYKERQSQTDRHEVQ